MEKIKLFWIQCFCLFADDGLKMNHLELYICKVFDRNVSEKRYTLGTAIYLLESIF